MKVALFIPCYIEQFYPQVGIATLELLEKLGCDVEYPLQQTCCGQPLANSGMEAEAMPIYHHFVDTFKNYEYIVAPSGSCTHQVQHHYGILEQTTEVTEVRKATYDLVDFLVDILKIEKLKARFPHRVGLHMSCHGLRGLRQGKSTELVGGEFSKLTYLLQMVADIELVPLERADECCGFGGTFAVNEEAISVKMGKDRIQDHIQNHAEYITAGDMSCLMHLEGVANRQEQPVKIIHIAEILNSYIP